MPSDAEISAAVRHELGRDPQVTEPEVIAVTVRDGSVALTGQTMTYAAKLAAALAAARVHGVRAVADELEVRLSGQPRDDSDIARAIAHTLERNISIPDDRVRARVQDGRVTLDGRVDYDFQRYEAEGVVRHVRGVTGITNDIHVARPAGAVRIEAEIEAAFSRAAQVDARHIRVEVCQHTARLYGHVRSLNEATAARAAAQAAPGVAAVEDYLMVAP
jgi:osmotically-inducible protein OsmY